MRGTTPTRDDELRAWLRKGDPVEGEAGLTTDEARAMRRLVVAAAGERSPRLLTLWRTAMVAAAATFALAVFYERGDLRGLRIGDEPSVQTARPARDVADEPRQIQFSTPGGTRIIWLLDPEFRM